MKELDLKLTSIKVEAKTMPLRAKWTRMMADDLFIMVDVRNNRISKIKKIWKIE